MTKATARYKCPTCDYHTDNWYEYAVHLKGHFADRAKGDEADDEKYQLEGAD